jgi:hypothetical protein
MRYYDDFLSYAVEKKEWHAAATVAREAADHSLRTGKTYDRYYLGRAVDAWTRAARENREASGPVDLSANAFHAAIDAATALGDLESCGRLYAEMAELPLGEKRRLRYGALAKRYAAMPSEQSPPPVGFPDYLRSKDAYADIWRHDLIELELGGEPSAVLARHVVEHPLSTDYRRAPLLALLLYSDPGFAMENAKAVAELALMLGQGMTYEMLSPLERLYDHQEPEVRAAVMRAVSSISVTRTYGLIRKGLADPAPVVVEEALQALRTVHFVSGLDSVKRIFRESTEPRVRLAALEGIGQIRSTEAALVLIEAVRQETGAIRAAAEGQLGKLSGDETASLIRQARDAETGDRREILDRVLKAVH